MSTTFFKLVVGHLVESISSLFLILLLMMEAPERMTKAERDKTQKKNKNLLQKQLKVLRNPDKLAFKG